MTLIVDSRVLLLDPPAYCVNLLRGTDKYWVQLTEWPEQIHLRMWSCPLKHVGDVAALVEELRVAVYEASPEDLVTQRAINLMPSGWDFWPGVPAEIATELRGGQFAAALATVKPSAR